jgi:hypothetical protein
MASKTQILPLPRRVRPWVLILAQLTLLAILVSGLKPFITLAVMDTNSSGYLSLSIQTVTQPRIATLTPKNSLQYSPPQVIDPPEIERLYHSLFQR